MSGDLWGRLGRWCSELCCCGLLGGIKSCCVVSGEAVAAAVSAVEDLKLSDEVNAESVGIKVNDEEDNEEEEVEIDHEKILLECFQCAIRFKSKEFKLPLIVSTFMKIMQTCW